MNENDLSNEIFKLTSEFRDKACKVLNSAFQNNPDTIYMFPNEKERKEKLIYAFESMYKYGIKNGEVYATSKNLEGITIWLPSKKVSPSTFSMLIRYGGFRTARKSGMEAGKRSIPFFKYMESTHMRLAPFDHWYVQTIGVEPKEQGKGYGGFLLKTLIKKHGEVPIYIESHKEENVSIYQKYGFEVIEHGKIPDTDIPLWCMLRKPI